MSTRPHLAPEVVISDGDMTTTLTSEPSIIQKLSLLSYGYSWSGASPVGSVSIQFSNDYQPSANGYGPPANAGTWNTATIDVNGSPVTSLPVSGNSGSDFIDITRGTGAYAIRTVYTPVSGTGSLTVTVAGKVS